MNPPFLHLPTRTTPDWRAVAEHVAKHGPVYLNDPLIKGNAAHVSLHRFGLGLYKHPHGGWVVNHLAVRKLENAR